MPHRKSSMFVVLIAVSACLLLAFALLGATPKRRTASARGPALAKRGEYLVTVTGCNDCHTPGTFYGAPDFHRMLSGSEVGWIGPWGVVYARNLTPDAETGLGKWRASEIVSTIRTGLTPDGRHLAPIMPWMDFAKLTDADANAIAAYLKSIPAVSHKVPDAVPPDQAAGVPGVTFPPPPAWDAPPGGGPAGGK